MPVFSSSQVDYRDLNLGQRFREARQQHHMTLHELADRTAISVGRLSQIENDQHVLDMRQVLVIAEALDVLPESIFPPEVSEPFQICRDAHVRSRRPERIPVLGPEKLNPEPHHNLWWPLADLFVGRHMEPLLGRVMPMSDEQLRLSYHDGDEFIFVLRGNMEFRMKAPDGLRRETLRAGDCMYVKSEFPHCVRSLEEEPAEVIRVLWSNAVPVQPGWDSFSRRTAAYDANGAGDLTRVAQREMAVLREERGWTAEEVAGQIGVTPSRLTKIESGTRPAPLDLMMKLARIYGKPLRQLFRGATQQGPYYFVRRSKDVPSLDPRTRRRFRGKPEAAEAARYCPLVTGFPRRHMFPYLVRSPSAAESPTQHEHHGQEFIYVLDGQLELMSWAEDEQVKETLGPGDSCFLESSVPHSFYGRSRNPYSEISAEVIVVFWCPLGETYLFEE